ncbi:MAG: carboxypeptidase regulatory-like domain-containing protein [Candidatus Peribacteraceae bacterium]
MRFSSVRILSALVAAGASFVLFVSAAAAFGPTTGGPPDTQQGAPPDAYVDRGFDLTLSGATVNTGTVLLRRNTGNTMAGAASGTNLCTRVNMFNGQAGTQMVACEHAQLSTETWYTATFTTGIKTATGMALGAAYSYRFQTGNFSGGGNFIPPATIMNYVPRGGASFPINAKIRVYFRPGGSSTGSTMATNGTGSVLSTTNVQLYVDSNGQPSGGNLLACALVGGNPASPTDCNMAWLSTTKELVITPGKKAPAGSVGTTGTAMVSGTKYLLKIKGGFGGVSVKNTDGSPLMMPSGGNEMIIPFVAAATDSTGPDVSGTFPQANAVGVDRAVYNISVGFTEAVDAATISSSTVKLYSSGTNGNCEAGVGDDVLVTGTTAEYNEEDGSAILSPNAILASTKKYCVLVTTGIKDIAGNSFDGDTSTGGNQNDEIAFTTGANVNGQGTDTTKPTIVSASADNFTIYVRLSEPLRFNAAKNATKSSSTGSYDVNNVNNWTVEAPTGLSVNMAGKTIEYVPSDLTLEIGNLMLPPGQSFRVKVATNTGAVRIQDLSGNTVATTGSPPGNEATGSVSSAMDSGGPGPGGDFNFGGNGQIRTEVMPATPLAGATGVFYRVQVNASKSIAAGGKFVLTFPTGFSFGASCATAPSVPENNDVNGPAAGAVTIASIACSNTARTVTVTTAGAATGTGMLVRFVVQGITNSPVPKDPSTAGYSVQVDTKNGNGALLETRTSMPFFLMQGGSQSIAGTVFKDNGVGGGTANNGVKDGGEPGVKNLKICIQGFQGFSCATTNTIGAYSGSSLSNGHYRVLFAMDNSSGSFIAQTSQQDVDLAGGQNKTNINFPLSVSDANITVSLSGIPASTNLDVFAFKQMGQGSPIVRTVSYGGATASISIPVPNGTYMVGVGPEMNKDPQAGGNTMPVFTFLPPQPQPVTVSGSNASVSIALQSASNTIKARVITAAGAGITNAFVGARPQSGSAQGVGGDSVAQSASGGTVSIPVTTGNYAVMAFLPGSSASSPVSVEVRANVSNTDGNLDADVYMNGALVTAANPLNLTVSQGGLSISGKVLDENSNPISYANVRAELLDGSGNFAGRFMEAPTSSAGSYTIYVDAGTWRVNSFAPGYGEVGSQTVTVTTANATLNLQAATADYGTISGTLKQNGVGVAGAFINGYGTSGGNHVVTGSGGVYSMKVRAGTYTIEGFVPGTGPTTRLTSIAVAAGQSVTGKNLTLAQAGTIAVTITGMTDAFVEVRDSSGQGNGTSSNTAGVYTLTVPAGTYTVRAGSPRLGRIGEQSSVAVTGGSQASVTLTPLPTYAISGQVSSSSTSCVSGVGMGFADSNHGRTVMAVTSATGTFTVSLPNGTFRMLAGKPGCIDNDTPATVVVNGAALTGANRTLEGTTQTITGNVTLDGTPITFGAKVVGQNAAGKYVFADVTNGAYTLNVTSGTWAVAARADGYASSSISVAAGGTMNLPLSALSGYTRQSPGTSQMTPTAGGRVKNSNIGANFAVDMPASALSSTDTNAATITTQQTSEFVPQTNAVQIIGNSAIEITPTDSNGNSISTLNSNATIQIPYTAADVTAAGTTEDKIAIYTWNDSTQQYDPLSTSVDTTNKILMASTSHFSTFAVGAARSSGTSSASSTSSTSGTTGGRGGGGGGRGRRSVALTETAPAVTRAVPIPAPMNRVLVILTQPQLKSIRGFLSQNIGGRNVLFRDVPTSQWFAASVATVLKAGIAAGYRDTQGNLTGEYGPGNNVTYAEIAKMALGAAGYSPSPADIPGNPSARNHWSSGYIALTEGLGAVVYRGQPVVDEFASRGAVMQTLVDILKVTDTTVVVAEQPKAVTGTGTVTSGSGTLTTGSGTVQTGTGAAATGSGALKTGTGALVTSTTVTPPSKEVTFTDLQSSHPHAKAILLLAKLGVISGDTDRKGVPTGKVRPNAPVNRAEVAKIFSKLIELKYIK